MMMETGMALDDVSYGKSACDLDEAMPDLHPTSTPLFAEYMMDNRPHHPTRN